MNLRIRINRNKRRRWLTAGIAAILAAAAISVVDSEPAAAVHDTGAFELDGNAVNGPALGDDWDNVCHQVLGADCSTSSDTSGATAVDWVAEPNLNASIFTGGGSKDPQDVSKWGWKDGAGGLPDKDNLLHSFAARYTTSAGQVLFFGSDRYDNSGDAQQGFWFFQNEITRQGTGSGTFNGVHKTGDLLVVSDFSNGGATSTINVFEWNPACTKTGDVVGVKTCGDQNLLTLASSTAANCASAAANDTFCGIVNPGTITMPWSFTDKSATPNNQALNGEFYEGGVNLSSLGLADTCFASVSSETRSSTSTTAVLKDFILGGFGKCTSDVTTHSSITGSAPIGTGSVSVSDSATVTVLGAATWTGTVQFHLQGPTGSPLATSVDIGTPVPVNNANPTAVSTTAIVTAAGNYCWSAHFDALTPAEVPDADDNGANECFTITPVQPALPTTAGPDVLLGNPVTDTVNLSGTSNQPGTPAINPTTPGAPAGGTITFTLVKSDCTTLASGTGTNPQSVPVNGNGQYGPVSFTPDATGTYFWKASYAPAAGDPNNLASSFNGDCSDPNEDVVVRDTTASTSAQTWLPNDSATVTATGGALLNGTLSAQLYSDGTCGGGGGSAVSGQLYQKTLTNATTVADRTLTTNNTTYTVETSTSVSWLVTFTSSDPNVAGSNHCESTTLTITN